MEQIGNIYQMPNNRVAIACLIDSLENEGYQVEQSRSFEDRGETNYLISSTKSGKLHIFGKILGTRGRVYTKSCPHLDEFLSRFDLKQTPYSLHDKEEI